MADLQKVLNAIETVLGDAANHGCHEPLAGQMFIHFESPEEHDHELDCVVKWQYWITAWGLLTSLLENIEQINFEKVKMVKTGCSPNDWKEDESESCDGWVETSEVMRRLADEDYWIL